MRTLTSTLLDPRIVSCVCLLSLGGVACDEAPSSRTTDSGAAGLPDGASTDGASTDGAPTDASTDGPSIDTGPPTGDLLWLTLEDATSIAVPAIGNGTGSSYSTNPVDDFTVGQTGNGLRVDEEGEFLQLVQQTNINWNVGTIDFFFLPDGTQHDGVNHVLFSSTNASSRGGFLCRKASREDSNAFEVVFFDESGAPVGQASLSASSYAFTPGTWLNIRVTWDFSVDEDEQNVRIYLDGTEATYAITTMGPASMPLAAADEHLRFGVSSTADESPADGVLDEIRIFGSVMAP
jgi:hypothetical protein